MRTAIFLACILLFISELSAQRENNNLCYEIFGTVSYNYSNTKRQWSGEPNYYTYKTQEITFQPSGGYFLNRNIELLVDLRYSFSSIYDSDIDHLYKIHTVGFDIGASYNFQINPFLNVFVGSKVGLSWWRGGLFEDIYLYNYGWSKRQLSFPIILAGSRFALTKECSIMMLFQYSKTNLAYTPVSYWSMTEEDITYGFGFSIFL